MFVFLKHLNTLPNKQDFVCHARLNVGGKKISRNTVLPSVSPLVVCAKVDFLKKTLNKKTEISYFIHTIKYKTFYNPTKAENHNHFC